MKTADANAGSAVRDIRLIVQISAGLGNQLFQFALACSLSQRYHVRVTLDTSSFSGKGDRQFGLRPLGSAFQQANWVDRFLMRVSFGRNLNRVGRALGFGLRQYLLVRVDDRQSGYDEAVFRLVTPTLLAGYWQSPSYFEAVAAQVRSIVSHAAIACVRDCPLLDRIRGTDSVCVHVRRGDLVSNPEYASTYCVQPSEYFAAALSRLPEPAGTRHYFVFSDDRKWPRDHLPLDADHVTYVCELGERDPWEDLALMMSCKHFVIANSTFSWWAAWLGSSVDKCVVAPRRWLRNRLEPPQDLIPPEWKLI